MSDIRTLDATAPAASAIPSVASPGEPCEECTGSGGWYRYEPALEPSPGMLYLSCLHCRGSGRSGVLRPE